MADLSNDIAQQAVEPISSTADGQSATARSTADMVTADQYLAQKKAAKKRRRGISFTKLVPPGPADDCGRTGLGGFATPGSI